MRREAIDVPLAVHRELFSFNDWGRDKLMALAAPLDDARLDRPFEMGPGSLRTTLHHLWAAERVWLDRWLNPATAKFVEPEAGLPIAALWDRYRAAAAERDKFVAGLRDADLDRKITFTNARNETYSIPLRDMFFHVCNHGVYHRAQAVNMLRRVGSPTPQPGPDYIFMKIEKPESPALDVKSLQTCFAYADWSRDVVHAAAEGLTDAQLDRPFELGVGTLRDTLMHIHDGERWWHDIWTTSGTAPFPTREQRLSVAELRRRFNETAAKRNAYLAKLSDADLQRIVEVHPRPGVVRRFPVGVSMLQLWGHGTHHRAQANNMLRHVGVKPPAFDYILWWRQRSAA